MKLRLIHIMFLSTMFFFNCSKEETNNNQNNIVGQWFLTVINETDVESIDCYRESYIESDGKTITFYVLDRLVDGSCDLVLDSSGELTIIDDFYYLGDEVIEIYIEGNQLTWRVDMETTLVFRK